MFWYIINSETPEWKTFVKVNNITAITTEKDNYTKIRVHLMCGKAFRADKSCLRDLSIMLNLKSLIL